MYKVVLFSLFFRVFKYPADHPLTLIHLYRTQMLLALHLARSGFNLREGRQA